MLYECDFKLIEAYFKSEFLNYFNIVPHFMAHFLLRLYYTTHNKIWWQKNKNNTRNLLFMQNLSLLVWRSSRGLIGNKLTHKVTLRLTVLRLSCLL